MNTFEKISKLIEKLEQQTSRGEINWEVTPYKNIFQTSFVRFTVTVARELDGYGEEGDSYSLSLLNEAGQTIEQCTNKYLEMHPGGQLVALTLAELYMAAKRNALGVDKAIDEILDSF